MRKSPANRMAQPHLPFGRKDEPRPYDFRNPPRSEWLDALHSSFAARLSRAWTRLLRADVTVALEFVEPIRYQDFIYSLGPGTCLLALRADPPGAQFCLDLSLAMMGPLVNRLSGEQADTLCRAGLSQVGRSLAARLIELAVAQLAQTWSEQIPIALREETMESSPSCLTIMPPDETVSVARFNVKLSDGDGGMMSLCLPAPVGDLLRQSAPPLSPARRDAQSQDMTRNVLDAEVLLQASLATARLRLVEVLTLEVGDIITTEVPVSQSATVHVGGKPKFTARLGQFRGVSAIQITGGAA